MRKWLTSGFWAIIDQGTYAGTNFIVNIILARWLEPNEYGAFAVGYAAFVFVVVVHTSLVLEPVLVFHSGRFQSRSAEYVAALFGWQLILGLGCASLLALLGGALLSLQFASGVAATLFGAALALPMVLTLWFFRRVCYLTLTPTHAAVASIAYLAVSCGSLTGVWAAGLLDGFTAFCVLGVATLPISAWFFIRIGHGSAPGFASDLGREVFWRHLRYGRWSFGGNCINWLRDNAFLFILPVSSGLEASGAMRALMNLVLPFLQVATSLSTILIPALVKARGGPNFRTLLRGFGIAMVTFGAVVWLPLAIGSDRLIALAYGGRYLEQADLLWILGAIPLAHFIILTVWSVHLAAERPSAVFRVLLVTTVPALVVGVPFVVAFGLSAAAATLTAVFFVTAAGFVLSLRNGRLVPRPIEPLGIRVGAMTADASISNSGAASASPGECRSDHRGTSE